MFETHLDLERDVTISKFEKVLNEIKQTVGRYNIHLVNIQPKFSISDNKQIINNENFNTMHR